MKRVLIYLVIMLSIAVPSEARRSAEGPVELTIYPSKAGELGKEYQLMVNVEDQIDADAVPLYEKTIKSIPKDFDQDQISEWLKLPVEQFPQEQAEETLQKYLEPLKLAVRATMCSQCNWPEWKPGDKALETKGYRKIASILELWARLEISRRGYEGAAIAMRTGFAVARDLGQAPTIIHAMIGAAVGELMCREIAQFVQAKDSPNLYRSLADLPRPLVDIQKAIEKEKKATLQSSLNPLMKEQIEKQLATAQARTLVISKRLTNNLNALQCVEAIKHYANEHNGQLPKTLSDISAIEIPKDVIGGREFEYSCSSEGAVLKSAMPQGGGPKDMINYVIVLKK